MAKLFVLIHGLLDSKISLWMGEGEIIHLGVIYTHHEHPDFYHQDSLLPPAWLWPTALPGVCGCPAPAPASTHTHKHTFHCPLASLVQPLPLQADGFGQDIPPSCLPTGCCFVIWLHTYTLLPLLATFQKTLHGQKPQNTRDNPKQGSSPSSRLISSSLYIRVNANHCTVVLTSV